MFFELRIKTVFLFFVLFFFMYGSLRGGVHRGGEVFLDANLKSLLSFSDYWESHVFNYRLRKWSIREEISWYLKAG